MNFNDADILSYNISYEFFGEGVYNFRKVKNVNVSGTIIDDSIVNGDSGIIMSRINNIIQSKDILSIQIAGQDFGQGRIVSLEFPEQNQVNTQEYSAQIEIYEEGNLINFPVSILSPEMIQSISESFSLNENSENNKSFEYQLSIQYIEGNNVSSAIQSAKTLAQNFVAESDIIFYINENVDIKEYKKYNTETIDLVLGLYQLSKKFEIRSDDNENYSSEITVEVSTSEDGITVVSERGSIKGIKGNNAEEIFSYAENGAKKEINNESFSRCSSVFQNYVIQSDADPIIDKKLFLSVQNDKINGQILYSLSYSNDKRINSNYDWEYVLEISKQQGEYIITESGIVIGHGKPKDSIEIAKSVFKNNVENGVDERVKKFYQDNTSDYRPINIQTSSTAFNEMDGSLNYSRQYTNRPAEKFGNIKSESIIDHTLPVQLVNNFEIINFKEIPQDTKIATVGNSNLSIEMWGERGLKKSNYIQHIRNIISQYYPSKLINGCEAVYIESASYDFEPKENRFTAKISWNWHSKEQDAIQNNFLE